MTVLLFAVHKGIGLIDGLLGGCVVVILRNQLPATPQRTGVKGLFKVGAQKSFSGPCGLGILSKFTLDSIELLLLVELCKSLSFQTLFLILYFFLCLMILNVELIVL